MSEHIIAHEAPAITPFWQRLPRFFRYPLHVEPLLYMALLAAATLLGFVLPLPSPLDHLLVHLGVWLAFIRYAYKTLDQTAQGRLSPEEHQLHADPGRKDLPYKQFAIFVVMGFALAFAEPLGGLVVGVATVFVTLAIPASVMILALTQSFWSGLNPLALASMMRLIGLPYLGLWAFLFLLMASQEVLMSLLLPALPGWLLLPALNFVAMYFTLIMFNMMGYVVYQYHGRLGVEVQTAAASAEATSADAIGRLVGEGRIDDALELAYEAQRVAPDDLAAQQRYHKLLLLAGRDDRLLPHGKRYLGLLLQKGRGDEALETYKLLVARDAAFAPELPAQLLELAEAARRQRDFALAMSLVKGFDKRFPRHPAIPSVYLFAARLLCEHYQQEAGARRIFATLLERYPEHPAGAEARQYLEVLDRLAASPAAAS